MATIKAIESRSIHQIQSGQVIVDLQSVCKELVENSIDAGATSIEIRFRNSGLDTVEVQDNGVGVAPADYETVALKHYTSKLATYDDISTLQTFGFRGEALSSLCALSKFHIVTTRASDGAKGNKLEFEQSGKLKATSVVAAKQGTTVTVETLFQNLPVRRKELEKNIKREYNKVLLLLNAYACISTGIKFSVSNQTSKGKKTVAFSTNANLSTKDNISNVYGAKTVQALIPLSLDFEMEPPTRASVAQSARNWSTQELVESRTVKIVGHISRPVVGEGRQTPDRQMFFVNSRPCNLPQIAKAFNEVYKSFNITQSPFILADIKLDTNAYDVNVSPDKRTIMLHDQTVLLENLKESLSAMFGNHDQSVPQAQPLGKKSISSSLKAATLQPRESTESSTIEENGKHRNVGKLGASHETYEEVTSPTQTWPSTAHAKFVKASLVGRSNSCNAEDGQRSASARRTRTESPETGKQSVTRAPSISDPASPEQSTVVDQSRIRIRSPFSEQDLLNEHISSQSTPLSRPVQDLDEWTVSQNNRPSLRDQSVKSHDTVAGEDEQRQNFSAIDQILPRTAVRSTIQDVFNHIRPMRTPLRQATITIGDCTTVATIGNENETVSSREARSHVSKSSLSERPDRTTPKVLLLSKFIAPGTQPGSSDTGDKDEDGQQSNEVTRTETRSPSSSGHPSLYTSRILNTSDADDTEDTIMIPPVFVENQGCDVEELPNFGAQSESAIGDSDDDYIDEMEKKAREEAKVAQMIIDAEETAARPTDTNLKRAGKLFKVSQKKYRTVDLERLIQTSVETISRQMMMNDSCIQAQDQSTTSTLAPDSAQLSGQDPEERLNLTVTKSDFRSMQIIGQFNLGFIITVRPSTSVSSASDLFIVDQHASDEKYNFERLSATTTLVSQRLVQPHHLELTAVEKEIILANEHTLSANGFVVEIDTSSSQHVSSRARLVSLPMSREVTFTPKDLEELLALISDDPVSSTGTPLLQSIPRPSKVRKILASRACRGSVMIGKTLQHSQMKEIIRHMGSMDKPWSCPHGRPTMRHLYGLEMWKGWTEGDGVTGIGVKGERQTDWEEFLRIRRENSQGSREQLAEEGG